MVALAYFLIGHGHPAEWEEFALEVVGAETAGCDDGFLHLRLDDRLCRIAVTADEHPGVVAGWDVGGPDALGRVAEALSDLGVAATVLSDRESRRRGVAKAVRFRDPAGQTVEACWGQVVSTPFTSPKAVSRFVVNGGGFGHLTITTPTPDAVTEFYTSVFGARLSDVWHRPEGDITFLRLSEREHSIAVMAASEFRVLHLMVEAGEIDDVGAAWDRALASRWRVTRGLGRHSNDASISFYVQTPSPFELEYGCESLVVDEAAWTVTQMSRGTIWGHHREPAPETP